MALAAAAAAAAAMGRRWRRGGGGGGDGGDRAEDVGTPTLPQLGRTDASRRMTRNSGAIPVVVMAAIDSSV